jgi:hypothetical protein
MNSSELREYKRDKSKKFNENMRQLRLQDKARQGNLQGSKQDDNQPDDNQPDNLTLQDLMDIFETLDTKMDIIQNKLETIMENKLYETLDTKMDIIQNKLETIIETKISEETFKTNQPINRQPSIFFA